MGARLMKAKKKAKRNRHRDARQKDIAQRAADASGRNDKPKARGR